MPVTTEFFCSQICGAKCCTLWSENITCPKLTTDCKCSIYEERFVEGSPDQEAVGFYIGRTKKGLPIIKPFVCGRIMHLIETKQLPQWVEDGCCFAHPDLLLNDYDTYKKEGNGTE